MKRRRIDIERALNEAVGHFWSTRNNQALKQAERGQSDAGSRSSVTGGAQMNGFVELVKSLLIENGAPESAIHCRRNVELPGWFRPEKCWDLILVFDNCLIASIEFKSQVGSFGNNYNNRTEEALGSATDIWAAYREGAFKPSARPWLGYLMLLEEAPRSMAPVRAREPHFKVFPEFEKASYAKRYEILLTKLVRERLYDGACLLLSSKEQGPKGKYHEPNPELSFRTFIASLLGKVLASVENSNS